MNSFRSPRWNAPGSFIVFTFISLLPFTAFAEPNPEDLPIEDAPVEDAPIEDAPVENVPIRDNRVEDVPEAPVSAAPSTLAAPGSQEPITITRSQWEAFLARQNALEAELAQLKEQVGKAPSTLPAEEQPLDPEDESKTASGEAAPRESSGNRSLLLPDISLIVTSRFNATNDRRDEDRNRFRLGEAEIGIQGYVYPNVKADAFIVAAPSEDEPFNIEEGYLTFIGLRKNLNLVAGRKFAPFGRTGEQHPHSWLYARQLLPRRNLISEENLTGDGLLARYLLPTGKNLFANLDLGIWNAAEGEEGTISSTPDEITSGPGVSFTDRFYTARLWASKAIGRNGELELGGSYARGDSALFNDDLGVGAEGKSSIMGLDATYRRFFNNDKRLLLRSEYFRYKPQGDLRSVARSASGWYGLANYRFNKRNDLGVLYERSGLLGNNERENALSLIYTRSLSEQFYFRLHGTRGSRPGGNYNQVVAQLTWGIGPHTHTLE